MYSDDQLVMISALQHFLYCPRQCALIHVEQQWGENLFTAEGKVMHERVDAPGKRSAIKIKTEYAVPLRSLSLGLTGRADVVEYHCKNDIWHPYPVEYKRGEPKTNRCDEVQLCAQAVCLEEMMSCAITEGSLFYGQTQHRVTVVFDAELRDLTVATAMAFHQMVDSGIIPPPVYERKKCDRCSLIDYCLPRTGGISAKRYLDEVME
ncbi:MAG: CRISPR-associated protein Cas4 [Victivallaceae bacterium]|nr:CRISPR-associated protein Cas4 [Victivallaceae bacterium]